jgi:ActR/RegA family two-component response regulator
MRTRSCGIFYATGLSSQSMTAAALAIIVDADLMELRTTVRVFERAGFVVMSSSSFAEARGLLASMAPELVVADIKLGAFNGLHLAAICGVSQPGTAFIATNTTYDHVLDSDAKQLNASYVVKTPGREELILTALTLLESQRQQHNSSLRRSFRKALPSQPVVHVAASDAKVVDVSYGGMRLTLNPGELPAVEEELPTVFDVVFPQLDLSLHATRVWVSPDSHSGGWVCGAALSDNDRPRVERWRDFVDSVH